MHTKIIVITLAVDDLDRSVAFYRDGLGWHTEGIVAQELHDEVTGADGTIAFFTLDNSLMIGLYERTNLAKDASMPAGPRSSTEFSLGPRPSRRPRSTRCSHKPKPLAAP
ncbi:MAG TPA: VOC family protein [Pseudonocardiaceae bacterium]|nr:VOC family protein [Pseudonocardiaceae bacterium]